MAASAKRTLSRALGVLGLIAFAWVYAYLRPELAAQLDLGNDAAPSRENASGSVRVATWNLRRFGDAEHPTDLVRLEEQLAKLDADLIALQEIMDPEGLARLRPGWKTLLSEGGGRGHQHVGFWWDPGRLQQVGEAQEFKELTMGGNVRPGLLATFERPDGPRFNVLVVHLKAKSEGQDLRAEQWERIVDALPRSRELPLVVLGDFNATGSPELSAQAERAAIAKRFEPIGLVPVTNPAGCSAYWQGAKRDAWLEGSQLDLIYTRGFQASAAWVGAHCGRHDCEDFRSTRAHPDPDYTGVSDHCPVLVDLSI